MSLIPARPTATTPHLTATSTGVADPKTITKPEFAQGMYLSAKTTAARVTFDGTVPAVGSNGIIIPAGALPMPFPFAVDVKFCADSAASSELNVLFVV